MNVAKILLISVVTLVTSLFAGTAQANSLIPVEHFFERSQYEDVVISPTGKYFAIKASDGPRDQIVIFDREQRKITTSFAFGDNIRFGGIAWVTPERIIFTGAKFVGYLDRQGGAPSLYAANADGSERREIFKVQRSSFTILDLLPNDPEHILIAKRHFADGGEAKAHLLNINDGREYFVGDQPPRANGLLADNTGKIRLAVAYEETRKDEFGKGTSWFYYRSPDNDEWKELKMDGLSAQTVGFAGFAADNRYAYMYSAHETKTQVVYQFDTATAKIEKIAENPIVDMYERVTGLNKETVAFDFMPGYIERVYIDDSASAKLLKNLEQAFPNQRVTIRSVTQDGKQAVVFVRSDRNAGEYYIFDTGTLKAGYIASPKPKLDPEAMASVKPFSYTARDGLTIHGYITLPNGYDGKQPLPTIMNIHGGPHGVRDDWSFSDENQFFANRGYAVVQVNFRGSGGYGQDFIEAGYRKWGREMQDDVTDATLWAIEQGYADKDRICIYGGSYGGYASLMGVVREPDLYQCSVGYVGVYSLPVFKTDGDIPARESGRRYLSRVVGDDKAELEANSPSFNVNRIKVPLYIVHGEDDVRVPMAQYDALTRALKAAKKPYKSMVRDEGHGFQKEHNRFDLYRELELFFAEHIGGAKAP
jgi:dipeptidyl aminopeptidase/acylaminoacyl peptidase